MSKLINVLHIRVNLTLSPFGDNIVFFHIANIF